jgi:FkbM family methyltransferase
LELTIKQIVINHFINQPNGKFLEIGSHDGEPTNDSEPCWGLVEKGWSGVYCEPNPMSCAQLMKNVMQFGERIKIINGALGKENGLKTFYVSVDKGMSSSFCKEWMSEQTYHEPNDRQYPIITNTFTIDTLLDTVGYDFDAVSIDIETPTDVFSNMLNGFDFSKLTNCKLIMLEVAPIWVRDSLVNLGYNGFGCGVGSMYLRNI